MAIDHTFYLDKKNKNVFYSWVFALSIVFITVVLFFVNVYLEKANTAKKSEVAVIEASILTVKSDKRVQIKELVDLNQGLLEKMHERSNIVAYVNHTREIRSKYGIALEGFNYANGKLAMTSKVNTDERGVAYSKLSHFIESYRKDPEAKFNLLFVNSVNGQDSMTLAVNFDVK